MSNYIERAPEHIVVRRRADWLSGIGGAAVVAVMAVALWVQPTPPSQTAFGISVVVLAHAAYLISMVTTVHFYQSVSRIRLMRLCMVIQALAVLALHLLDPREIYLYETLVVIWSAELPYFLSVTKSVIMGGALLLLCAAIRYWHGPQYFLIHELVLHFFFTSFAIVSSRNAIAAEDARELLTQRNAELEATRELLAAGAKERERLRIARDLHDTIGHHLTALCLRLELAHHQDLDDARLAQEQAHHIARLLLADVRATVSRMRAMPDTNLHRLIDTLTHAIPRLQIIKEIPDTLDIFDSRITEAIFRVTQEVITNTIRHSGAQLLHLRISADDRHVHFLAYDDGKLGQGYEPGNGLRGIQERISALGGRVQLDRTENDSMCIALSLPREPI